MEVSAGNLDRRTVAITWATIAAVAFVITVFWSYPSWFASDPVDECDAVIQATLKAPSTYERISASGTNGSYYVTYEAQNSFGVPLRSSGSCTVTGGQAEWVPLIG